MKDMRRTLPVLASLCLAAGPAAAYEYSAAAMHGWLVDAETRKPIAGAIVVAEWTLEFGMEGGGGYNWVVREALTDANGRFDIAAWGPLEVPAFLPREAALKGRDPKVVFFKYGYAGIQDTPSQAGKEYARAKTFYGRGAKSRRWLLDGETFLYRATADADLIAKEVHALDLFLSVMRAPCTFMFIPRAIQALAQARERLAAAAPQTNARFRYGPSSHERWLAGGAAYEAMQKKECGTSAREALARLGEER